MRSQLSGDIRTLLTTQLEAYNVVVIDASIEDLDFSDAFTDAVEAKQVAEQKSKQAKIEQEQKNMEAEAAAKRAEIEAKAEAAVAKIAAETDLEVVKIQADAAEYAGQKDAAVIGQVRDILAKDPDYYDAYIIIDADCVLDKRYCEEMNNALSKGADVYSSKKLVKKIWIIFNFINIKFIHNFCKCCK